MIFTFTQNPTWVLSGLSAQNIITNEERRAMLEEEGIDCLVECPFVPELAHMEPERFVEKILVEQLKAAFIAVGTDFHFGYQRRGDYELLLKLGDRYGFQVENAPERAVPRFAVLVFISTAIVLGIIVALILKNTAFRGKPVPFVRGKKYGHFSVTV